MFKKSTKSIFLCTLCQAMVWWLVGKNTYVHSMRDIKHINETLVFSEYYAPINETGWVILQ